MNGFVYKNSAEGLFVNCWLLTLLINLLWPCQGEAEVAAEETSSEVEIEHVYIEEEIEEEVQTSDEEVRISSVSLI